VCLCASVRVSMCVCACVYVHVCLHVYMRVHVFVCEGSHAHVRELQQSERARVRAKLESTRESVGERNSKSEREEERERERESDRERGREGERERQRERQREREREREREAWTIQPFESFEPFQMILCTGALVVVSHSICRIFRALRGKSFARLRNSLPPPLFVCTCSSLQFVLCTLPLSLTRGALSISAVHAYALTRACSLVFKATDCTGIHLGSGICVGHNPLSHDRFHRHLVKMWNRFS